LRRLDTTNNATADPAGEGGHGQIKVGDYFVLSHVGYEKYPVELPHSSHSEDARCLTVRESFTSNGGRDLYWDTCQNQNCRSGRCQAQSWTFNPDGTVSDKIHGHCLRRFPCKENNLDVLVYDLADCQSCRSDGMDCEIAKFEVQKLQANSMEEEHARDLGYLRKAADIELCALTKMCGPWKVTHHFKRGGYQAKPGWTKGASQYVGIDAIMGRSTYHTNVKAKGRLEQELGVEYDGLGEIGNGAGINQNVYCGTHTADTLSKGSLFYILLTDDSYSYINQQTSLNHGMQVHSTAVSL
jgi:hypothetical protein